MSGAKIFRPGSRRRATCPGCGSKQTITPPDELDAEAFAAWLEQIAVCPNCGTERELR